jgi:hypothetical protein
MRRWSFGALTAVVLGICTALTVASIPSRSRWEVALHLSPSGIELSATSEHARLAVRL